VGALRAAALALEFGFIVGGSVIAGLLGGRWLDEVFHTEPAFFLAGLLLGLASGPFLIYLMVRYQQRKGR